ncbi:MAG: valine--tRNA ligase [Williamsia sp.]|nr:valine--tRNA ligase [Williamsia sp.]
MELSKNYLPAGTEEKWYRHWLGKGYFNSTPDERPAFTVVIPPPNVTGVLHMGHTLNETVQDILVRRARMSGYNACWVPGSDHASIATEAKVVGMLKERGIDKTTISRKEFLQYAYEWKEKYGGIIYNQIEKLGCSVDWNRVTFTMDDHYYKAVIKVFVDLYNKGLIYRGARMINWDPAAKTALSDEEVEYRDVQGKLYYLKYMLDESSLSQDENRDDKSAAWVPTEDQTINNDPLGVAVESMKDESAWLLNGTPLTPEEINGDAAATTGAAARSYNYITIATQRPETIMGDTAICVNPHDERYKHLRGAYAYVPLINRRVPIIFDEYIDKDFGTGVLKVTPAHDINDYNLGLKYNLDIINTLNEDGTLSEAAEIFVGEDRFTARKKIVQALEEKGHLLKEETYPTRLGYSQRTGVVVEPMISTQWFLKMKELAGPALEAVTEEKILIHPGEKFLATYRYWMENVKDWCISRQLWWGQQIPAWYDEGGNVVVGEDAAAARAAYAEKWGESAAAQAQLTQDEDVLDTWFSSWLWPMEVFNGITRPGNPELKYYYPTSVLVTGQDIIFFWVARMIMAGMEYEKGIPFKHVYFTGMVRDKQGRKMSKSLGNSPDLLELIDKYGADAVRFGIMISSPAGNDLLFDDASLEQGRNFNNKLWNALKLVKGWSSRVGEEEREGEAHFAADWFQSRLQQAGSEIGSLLSQFRLSEALKTLYSLMWDDFCSWYLEWIKPAQEGSLPLSVYNRTVDYFTQLIQLLHPFMPFITEEIYHLLADRSDDLCVKQLAAPAQADALILEQGQLLKDVITAIRDARNKHGIKPKESIQLRIQTSSQTLYQRIQPILLKQVNAEAIVYTAEVVPGAIAVVSGKDTLYLQTDRPLDTTGQRDNLLKEIDYLKGFITIIDKKLGNERFIQNAKPEVVELERRKRSDAETKIKVIEESLAGLS